MSPYASPRVTGAEHDALLARLAAEAARRRVAAGELPGVAELHGLIDAIGALRLLDRRASGDRGPADDPGRGPGGAT